MLNFDKKNYLKDPGYLVKTCMASLIASIAREARRKQSELYGREYDQGKVTYNDIYFQ